MQKTFFLATCSQKKKKKKKKPKQRGKKIPYREKTEIKERSPAVVLTPASATLIKRVQYLDNFWPHSQFKLFLYDQNLIYSLELIYYNTAKWTLKMNLL